MPVIDGNMSRKPTGYIDSIQRQEDNDVKAGSGQVPSYPVITY